MTELLQNTMAAYEQHAKSLAEANDINKNAVFAALKAESITTVRVLFDGAGDSGQIQEVSAETANGSIALPDVQIEMQHASWGGKVTSAKMQLRDAIDELCFDYLSQEHGGWENNDGGEGEFTFRAEDSSLDLDFVQFYTESTTHSHTF
jgi:hypothetical protein